MDTCQDSPKNLFELAPIAAVRQGQGGRVNAGALSNAPQQQHN